MSDDAVRHAKAWTHPKATRSIHAFFEAIAERIPAGQTTTPPVTLDELAAGSHQVERTARTNRDFLVGIGQVKVHDGGRGIKDARYEMLQLTSGERPIVPAPLPLMGRPKPPKPKKAKGQWRRSDLFADLYEERSDQRSDQITDVAQRSDLFADVWHKVGSFCRPLWNKVGSFCRRLFPLRVPITDRPSSLSTYVKEEVEASSSGSYVPAANVHDDDRVRALLAWWLEMFPELRDGAQYTLKPWDPRKAAELLKGRTLEFVQQMCALAMTWPQGSRDDWLATCPDFGISAVLWKANLLDEEVRRLAREAERVAGVETAAAERKERAERAEATRQEAMEAAEQEYAHLSEAVRAELELDAREELKDWRPKMAPATFERTVHQTVLRYLQDPRVRDRFEIEQREKYG